MFMADEKVQVIAAGSREVYEVVESGDGLLVTIRMAANHDHKIELANSAIPALIGALQKIAPH
jgi:bifunctional ADP-heptose synthase (sugar kinase/adenylyltransferase)